MALKVKIDKATFDKLDDKIKFEYAADGDSYVLQTEGGEDIGPLRRANDRLKSQVKTLEDSNDELTLKLEKIDKNPARKQGDIDALEKQWTKEKEAAVKEVQDKLDKRDGYIKQTAKQHAAQEIAAKISTAPGVIRPHIESRIDIDMSGDAPKVVYLDKDGKASALTSDKLGEEFVANKEFSSIIRSNTKASGGAGQPSQTAMPSSKPLGQSTNQQGNDTPNLASMDPRALADHLKAKKAADDNPQQ